MDVTLERTLKIEGEYDVVVCGAGPAGICAAVSSARLHKSTLLIERYGVVGGNLTSGLVGPVMGRTAKGTMTDEINNLIGGDVPIKMAFDPELAKIRLTELLEESGVEFRLQTAVVDVLMNENTICGVVVSSALGLAAIKAKIVVDCTGDGTVSYLAGAEYRAGRESDGLQQPVTIMFRMNGVDESVAINPGDWTFKVRMPKTKESDWFFKYCVDACDQKFLPKSVSLVRLYRTSRPGECHVNATHMNYINGLDPKDISRAEAVLRKQIPIIVDFIKKNVQGFEKCYLVNSSTTLGIRDTRRIMGEYILSRDDLETARKFDDVVVHDAWFFMDIHNMAGGGQTLTDVPPYDIPYRCLVPLGIENLLTAGRCISGTHEAHASYRIMSVCMSTGQAAGIAAALCIENNEKPRILDYHKVQKRLIETGAILFD